MFSPIKTRIQWGRLTSQNGTVLANIQRTIQGTQSFTCCQVREQEFTIEFVLAKDEISNIAIYHLTNPVQPSSPRIFNVEGVTLANFQFKPPHLKVNGGIIEGGPPILGLKNVTLISNLRSLQNRRPEHSSIWRSHSASLRLTTIHPFFRNDGRPKKLLQERLPLGGWVKLTQEPVVTYLLHSDNEKCDYWALRPVWISRASKGASNR